MKPRVKDTEEKGGKTVYFYLIEDDNKVNLLGKNINGNTFYIGSLKEDGLKLFSGINEDSGLPLDSEGRIRVTD